MGHGWLGLWVAVDGWDGFVGKFGFASHTKHTAEATDTDLLHL